MKSVTSDECQVSRMAAAGKGIFPRFASLAMCRFAFPRHSSLVTRHFLLGFGICVLGFSLLTGCGKKSAAAGRPMGMMAVQVVAVEAKRQPVTESLSFVGSIVANEMVEIKSETEGTVQEISFKEGQQVQKGDLLLRLDETKFSTALSEAESNFKLSKANFDRAQQLFRDRLISQQEYDQAAAMFNMNQATVERRQRELKDARIYASFS